MKYTIGSVAQTWPYRLNGLDWVDLIGSGHVAFQCCAISYAT